MNNKWLDNDDDLSDNFDENPFDDGSPQNKERKESKKARKANESKKIDKRMFKRERW